MSKCSTSYSLACIQDGTPGKDGTSVTITSRSIDYKNSTNGSTVPSGDDWTASPQPIEGQYIWSRTIVNYSDDSSTVSYSVSYIPEETVAVSLSSYSWIFPTDEYGVVDVAEYAKLKIDVNVTKGTKAVTDFQLSRTENGISGTTISGSSLIGSLSTVMVGDSASILLGIVVDGVTYTKTVIIVKSKHSKGVTLYFTWCNSQTDFSPLVSKFWSYGTSLLYHGGSLFGYIPFTTTTWLTDWDEVQKRRNDEYCYLWAKVSEDSSPFLFSGPTGAYEKRQYYISTSRTTLAGGRWLDEAPSMINSGYLWIRYKQVPAGGTESKIAWSEPVVSAVGIEVTESKIALSANESELTVGDKVIRLKAPNVLAQGSVTANEIDVNDLAANTAFLKLLKVLNFLISNSTGLGVEIRSTDNDGNPLTNPIVKFTYNGGTIFQIDGASGNIFLGQPNEDLTDNLSGFYYNANEGYIKSPNGKVFISSDSVVLSNILISGDSVFNGRFNCEVIKTEAVSPTEYSFSHSASEGNLMAENIYKKFIEYGFTNGNMYNCSVSGYPTIKQVRVTMENPDTYWDYVANQHKDHKSYVYVIFFDIDGNIVTPTVSNPNQAYYQIGKKLTTCSYRGATSYMNYATDGISFSILIGGNKLLLDVPDSTSLSALPSGTVYKDSNGFLKIVT